MICFHAYSHGYFLSILQQSYAQCKALVLHKLKESMERLFTLDHTNGNGSETTVADIKTAYGLLLRATKLPGALHYKVIAEQVSWTCPYTSVLSTYSISTLAHTFYCNLIKECPTPTFDSVSSLGQSLPTSEWLTTALSIVTGTWPFA